MFRKQGKKYNQESGLFLLPHSLCFCFPPGMEVVGEKGRPSLGSSDWILTLIRSHPSTIWGSLSRAVPPLAVRPMPACVFLRLLKDHHLLATSGLYAHFFCQLLGVLSCRLPPCAPREFLVTLYFLFADAMQLNDTWRGLCWTSCIGHGSPHLLRHLSWQSPNPLTWLPKQPGCRDSLQPTCLRFTST